MLKQKVTEVTLHLTLFPSYSFCYACAKVVTELQALHCGCILCPTFPAEDTSDQATWLEALV